MTRNRIFLRIQSIWRLFQNHLVDVAPSPVLAGLDRLHDGMLCAVKMFGGVLILGGIAAAHMAANQAQAEMDPGVAHFQAFLASGTAGRHFADFLDVRATVCRHFVLLVRRRFLLGPAKNILDPDVPAILSCITVVNYRRRLVIFNRRSIPSCA
jgi:hypothetical protein